jgi:hypothetical protein
MEMLNRLVGKTSSSAARGKIGENVVLEWIRNLFPDGVTEADARPQAMDIRLTIGVIKIYIEVKMYSRSVSSKEVDKFKRDLIQSDTRFGIFVSLGQRISKIGRVLIERVGDKYAIYLPNATKSSVEWAIVFSRELNKLDESKHVDMMLINSFLQTNEGIAANIKKHIIRMKTELKNLERDLHEQNNLMTTTLHKCIKNSEVREIIKE